MALGGKKAAFVYEYVKDQNATKAAIRAGYSKRTAYAKGCDLKKDPEVQRGIQEWRDAINKQLELELQDIVQPLVEINRAKVSDYIDSDGKILLDENSPNLHAIKKYTTRSYTNKKGNETVTKTIELHPATGVNERLAVLLGLEKPAEMELKTNEFTFRMVGQRSHAPHAPNNEQDT